MIADLQDPEVPAAGVVVARQPIFDPGWEVIAYELLYRPVHDADGPATPESMTAGVFAGAFSDLGLDSLVGDRPAHINVTRDFMLAMRPLPLAPGRTVLELVEDQAVDAELVGALKEAVDAGFTLALDGYRHAPAGAAARPGVDRQAQHAGAHARRDRESSCARSSRAA